MKFIIKRLNYIFDRKQKIDLIKVFILITAGAFLELLGVSVILPFVNAILSPDTILGNSILSWVYYLFHFQNIYAFIAFLALCVIVVYIINKL